MISSSWCDVVLFVVFVRRLSFPSCSGVCSDQIVRSASISSADPTNDFGVINVSDPET